MDFNPWYTFLILTCSYANGNGNRSRLSDSKNAVEYFRYCFHEDITSKKRRLLVKISTLI